MSRSDKYEFQQTRHEDKEEIVEVSNLVFGPVIAFIPEELEKQLEISLDGQDCVKDRNHGNIAGVYSGLFINFENNSLNHSLVEITHNHFIRNHILKVKLSMSLSIRNIEDRVWEDFYTEPPGRIFRAHQLRNIMFGELIPQG